MEVDGVQVGQSIAIARFLAKKAGIAGKTDVEQALADGLVDYAKDLLQRKNQGWVSPSTSILVFLNSRPFHCTSGSQRLNSKDFLWGFQLFYNFELKFLFLFLRNLLVKLIGVNNVSLEICKVPKGNNKGKCNEPLF